MDSKTQLGILIGLVLLLIPATALAAAPGPAHVVLEDDGNYSCNYITRVNTWGNCIHHVQEATDVNWNSVRVASPASDCEHVVSLEKYCNSRPSARISLIKNTADELICRVLNYADSEGDDLSVTYIWSPSGIHVTTDGPKDVSESSSFDSYVEGETVACDATVSDGEGGTISLHTTINTLIINNPPATPLISVEGGFTTSPLSAVISGYDLCGPDCPNPSILIDSDGDIVSFDYEWYKNDVKTAYTTASVPDSALVEGDIWKLKVRAFDGMDFSPWATSTAVEIREVPESFIADTYLTSHTRQVQRSVSCYWERIGIFYHGPNCILIYDDDLTYYTSSYASSNGGSWSRCSAAYTPTGQMVGTCKRGVNCRHDSYAVRNTCTGTYYCSNTYGGSYSTTMTVTESYQLCNYIDAVTSWTSCQDHTQYASTVSWATVESETCGHAVPLERTCNNVPSMPAALTIPEDSCINADLECRVTGTSIDFDSADEIEYQYEWYYGGTKDDSKTSQSSSTTAVIIPAYGQNGEWACQVTPLDDWETAAAQGWCVEDACPPQSSYPVASADSDVDECIDCTTDAGACDPSLCPEGYYECVGATSGSCYCYSRINCTDEESGACDPSLCNSILPYCNDLGSYCGCSAQKACPAGHQACSSDADCPAGTPDCRDDGCCYEFTECENTSAPGACDTKDDCQAKLGTLNTQWKCQEDISASSGSINPDDCENCACKQILPSCNIEDGILLNGESCDSDDDCPDGGFCSPETCQCVCESPTECQAASSSCSIYDDCESAFGSGWKCSEVIDGGVTTCDCVKTTIESSCGDGSKDADEVCDPMADPTGCPLGESCTSSCECRVECSNAGACDASLCASGEACVPEGADCYCSSCTQISFEDCNSDADCSSGSCEGGICSTDGTALSGSACDSPVAQGNGYYCQPHDNANSEINGQNFRGYCFPDGYASCAKTLDPGACNEDYTGEVTCDFLTESISAEPVVFKEKSTLTSNKAGINIPWDFDVQFGQGCTVYSDTLGVSSIEHGSTEEVGTVTVEVPKGYVCEYNVLMTAPSGASKTQKCYVFSPESLLLPSESVPELPAITHPLGMYSTSPADAAEAYTKAFIAVDNCPGAEDSLTGAAAFLRSCNEGGANADLSCRLAQYYSQRAEEDMNFGRC